MNKTMKSTHSDNSLKLRKEVPTYAAPNPSVATLSPPIPPGSSKTQMGLNHPILAQYLCPVKSVAMFNRDMKG